MKRESFLGSCGVLFGRILTCWCPSSRENISGRTRTGSPSLCMHGIYVQSKGENTVREKNKMLWLGRGGGFESCFLAGWGLGFGTRLLNVLSHNHHYHSSMFDFR